MRKVSFMRQRTTASGIPWSVFAITVAGAFVVALDLSIVNVAFPSIGRSIVRTTFSRIQSLTGLKRGC